MIDKSSPTWAHVLTWVEDEINTLHLDLERPGSDATEFNRGKIAALRSLMDMGGETPYVDSQSY